jgi:hypothetical protein
LPTYSFIQTRGLSTLGAFLMRPRRYLPTASSTAVIDQRVGTSLRSAASPSAPTGPRAGGGGHVVEVPVEVRALGETDLHVHRAVGHRHLSLDADEAVPGVVDVHVGRAPGVQQARPVLEDVLDVQPAPVPLGTGGEALGVLLGFHRREDARGDVRVVAVADEHRGRGGAEQRVALARGLQSRRSVVEVVQDLVGLLLGEAAPLAAFLGFEPLDVVVELHDRS